MKQFYLFLLIVVFCSLGQAQVQIGSSSYPTLKAAFDAINTGTQTGNIAISITGDTTESSSAILYQSGYADGIGHHSSYSSIIITPSGSVQRTILFTANNAALLLQRASNVTIDGLNRLTIANAQPQATTIDLYSGASGNTITNCKVLGSGAIAVVHINGYSFGCNNNTISNCEIGPYDGNLPTNCIWAYAENTVQSGLVISGNTIHDYNSQTVGSNGIMMDGAQTIFTIQNNRFYQSAPRASLNNSAIYINTSNNFSSGERLITGNEIGSANATGTGTYTLTAGKFRGIFYTHIYTGFCRINNNIIRNIAVTGNSSGTGTNAGFAGIDVSNGGTEIKGNTIGSQTTTGSIVFSSSQNSEAVGILKTGDYPVDINDNTIGGMSVSGSGRESVRGIFCDISSGAYIPTINCNNNIIGGDIANSLITTSTINGAIANGIDISQMQGTINNNIIRNITGYGPGESYLPKGITGIYCMRSASLTAMSMSGNKIYNLANLNTADATFVNGIFYYNVAGSYDAAIEKNQIYNLTSATSNGAAEVDGIYCANSTPNINNNMITLGTNVGGASIFGIRNITMVDPVNGVYARNIRNNSIYIGGTQSFGSANSVGFYQEAGFAFSILDNIFVNNRSNEGGSGIHTSIRANLSYYNGVLFCAYKGNIFYGTGNGYVLGYTFTTPKTTVSQWNTSFSTAGNYGYFTDPKFIDATGATPNLHINANLPTMVEGKGSGNLGLDIDNEDRSVLSPNDIGADAGNFIGITQPVITGLSATSACTNAPISLVITGTGFTAVTQARIGATVFAITNASATSITINTGNTALSGNIFLTNEAGTGASSSVFSIYLPPSISVSPASGTVCSNAVKTFTVTAANTGSYQWRRNGVNLTNTPPFSNVTTATLTITNPNVSESGSTYDVIAYSPQQACSVISNAAALTVLPFTIPIIQASGATTFCAGNSITLSTPAAYASYLWSNGATTPTITVSASGNYTVAVTSANGCAATSTAMSISVNPNVTYYADADIDGYGNPAVTSVSCMGAPLGYVTNNTDCNDADITRHQTYSFYADTDGDTYGAGSAVAICAVSAAAAPSNYSINNTDCNDIDAAVYRAALLYTDLDSDGYTSAQAVVCYGASFPAGQSLTSNGNDCDDTDPQKHQTFPFYADADGDTYGAGDVVNICTVAFDIPQPGYVINNTDCDDTDAAKYRTYPFYADSDNDGYGAGGLVDVCSVNATSALGYSLNDADCNNNNAAIHPGASELLYDGVDNNCDGQIDENFQITTQLATCGTVLAAFESPINIATVGPEITQYRVKITNGINQWIFETGNPQFLLTNYLLPTYATTYTVAIELQRNGIWLGYYGNNCEATTPTPANGIFESYATVTTNSQNVTYDLQGDTFNPNFNGTYLGAFNDTDYVDVKGQSKLYAYGCTVATVNMRYRIYKNGEAPGTFDTVAESFQSNIEYPGGQVWESTSESPNLLQNLTPGNYTLEIYSDADADPCPAGTYLSNNSGNNYKATFKILKPYPVEVTATGGTPSALYTNLTTAFTAINSGTHTGNILVQVTGDTREANTGAVLNFAPQAASIRIEPVGHVMVSCAASFSTGQSVLRFVNCNNVTIDGLHTIDNSLTISSYSAASLFLQPKISAVEFFIGSNNTVKNCTILGSSTYIYNAFTNTSTLNGQGLNLSSVNNFTVSGCDFGTTGRLNPISAIFGSGNNVNITNNTIHDYFAEDVPSAGIRATSGNNWTITDNKFYQADPKVWSYNGSENAAILVMPSTVTGTSPGTSEGFTITGNTIGYASADKTGVYALEGNAGSPKAHFCGIHFKGLASANALPTIISNNTIASVALTSTSSKGTIANSPFVGILFESGVGTCNNNTIGSQTATGSLVYDAFNANFTGTNDVYGILNTSSNAFTSNNNNIGGMSIDSRLPPATYAMRSVGTNGVVWTANGNTIGGTSANSIQTSSAVYGIYNDGPNANLDSNVIRNLKGSSAVGIQLANTNTVSRNFIHSLNGNDISAIRVTSGESLFKNNMIALGENIGNATLSGFDDRGGNNRFYNNSIYIGGTATSGASDSFALVDTGTGNRDYRNNIVMNNRSNSAATGKNYVASVASNSGLTMNKNVYFGNAAANTFGKFNSAVITNLSNWQTATVQDIESYFANPQYLDPAAATPNLHINPSIQTVAEGKGLLLDVVTDDFDGQSRNAFTPTDIGADAGNFMILPPTITALSATSGCTGSSLTISGNYLAEVTQVFIGGTPATITATSATSVTVIVGTGTTGIVSVSNGAVASSATVFTVIPQITYYADNDGDGYGDNAVTTLSCIVPASYVANNTDCAPADATKWRTGNFYVDADNDGYYNGNPNTVPVCYGTTVPSGYAGAIIGTDCNDLNANVNPSHVEIPANGVDDNCDGTIDEAAPTTSLIASQCGFTMSNMANVIYASAVPTATAYRFEVTNASNIRIYDSSTNSFTFANLAGGGVFGTTYTVRVAVKTNGFWRSYFTVCTVTTPSAFETTQVVATQCGSTLALTSTAIYANQVTVATQYRFEVTNGTNVRTYDTPLNRFSLTNLSGTNDFGTTYIVRVALMIGGVWQTYGAPCSVTTPATPGYTNITSPQCGSTISNTWTTIYANPIAGAQGYRFEVKNGAQTRFYDSAVPRFSLHDLSGTIKPNTAYTIRVAILYNNVYQGYGSSCTINTAAAITRQTATAVVFEVKTSPNPFAATFRLEMNTTSSEQVEIEVYDMIGKLVEARQIGVAQFGSLEIGDRYPSGVYNLIVTQGENVKTLRVIKR
jgi:hypothetical protein